MLCGGKSIDKYGTPETSFLACVVDLACTRWMEVETENNTMRDILEADSVVLMDWLDRGGK